MSFVFADKLGEKVSESYNNPYDAIKNLIIKNTNNQNNKLCIVFDNRVIRILDTKMILVKWAVSCVKRVLHIFEEHYPDFKRPRKAIEAVSNWIKDPSEKNRMDCNFSNYYVYSHAVVVAADFTANAASASYFVYFVCDAFNAAFCASNAAPNPSLEIKWQRKKLNQIVYEEILLVFVMTQYQRIDKKLIRKIPKELLEYIASFITG